MLTLTAKFLEARELPAQEPYPPSCLVSLLAGTDTLHLIANREVFDQLEGTEPFSDVLLELGFRQLNFLLRLREAFSSLLAAKTVRDCLLEIGGPC